MSHPLTIWMRSGFESKMEGVAAAEDRTTKATTRCVEDPTPDARTAATAAADEFLVAARGAQQWLRENPAPAAEVQDAFLISFGAYIEAATILIGMGEDLSKMTPQEGARAADAVARAKHANYDGATAFARLVTGN